FARESDARAFRTLPTCLDLLCGLNLLVIGAVNAEVAFAERRIDKPAMVGARPVAMGVGCKVAAAKAHTLRRDGAAPLKFIDRARDNAKQVGLVFRGEHIDERAKAQWPALGQRA